MNNFFTQLQQSLSGVTTLSVVVRIILAAIVGGCIGAERGKHGRAAGLRTHILVCLGASLTALSGLYSVEVLGLDSDPLRIAAQVVSGIGFLGAGTILTQKPMQITGLTTAAGLWTTACIGISIGLGLYCTSLMAFLVLMITTTVLSRLERTKKSKCSEKYYIELCNSAAVNPLFDLLVNSNSEMLVVPSYSAIAGHVGIEFTVYSPQERSGKEEMLASLRKAQGVVFVLPIV